MSTRSPTRYTLSIILCAEGVYKVSPGSQASNMYAPSVSDMGSVWMVSKEVFPSGVRTKRFVIGEVMWEPGRKESAPLWAVH